MNILANALNQLSQSQNLILVLIFFTALLLGYAIYALIAGRRKPADRLENLLPEENMVDEKKDRPSLMEAEDTGFVAKVSTPLHKIILPSKDAAKKRIRRNLLQAGFRSKRALRNYLSLKVVLAVALPTLFLVRIVFVQFTPQIILICLFLAVTGFIIPNIVLRYLISKRQREILRALPDALDLMVICVEAGLGLDMTFKRVGTEIRSISPHLSDEFHLVNQEVRAGRPRDEAYQSLTDRTGLREVHNLMTILVQTSRFGTSVAKALRVHADAMRIKRRQTAEEMANKAAVKLVFPVVVFIFPSMFIVILGPAVIRIARTLLPALGGG